MGSIVFPAARALVAWLEQHGGNLDGVRALGIDLFFSSFWIWSSYMYGMVYIYVNVVMIFLVLIVWNRIFVVWLGFWWSWLWSSWFWSSCMFRIAHEWLRIWMPEGFQYENNFKDNFVIILQQSWAADLGRWDFQLALLVPMSFSLIFTSTLLWWGDVDM